MSVKLNLSYKNLGKLNRKSNRVLLNGDGSRELTNIGDMDGDGCLRVQPGYSKVLASPLIADYETGTVTVTNGGYEVTGSGTAFLANAVPGDLFEGPDEELYTIATVTSDTALTLLTAYAGTTASGAAYAIRARVWMLAPYYTTTGGSDVVVSQDYANLGGAAGSFANTEDDTLAGVSLDPSTRFLLEGADVNLLGLNAFYGSAKTYAMAVKFTVSENTSIARVFFPHYFDDAAVFGNSSRTYRIFVAADSSGSPASTPFTANADTGFITPVETEQHVIDLLGSATLVAGTVYWGVAILHADWITASEKLYCGYTTTGTATNYTPAAVKRFNGSTWGALSGATSLLLNFIGYQTAGTNAYQSPIFDMGLTPTQAGSASIQVLGSKIGGTWFGTHLDSGALSGNYAQVLSSAFYYTQTGYHTLRWQVDTSASADLSSNNAVTFGSAYTAATAGVSLANNTFTLSSAPGWAINDRVVYDNGGGASATGLTDGNAYFIKTISSDVISVTATVGGTAIDITGTGNNAQNFTLASQTGTSAAITGATNLKRYYRFTAYMLSSTGLSTPVLSGIGLTFPNTTDTSGGSYQLVGTKKSIYTTIASGASTISTTEVPMGVEVRPAYYQQKVFWSTGGQAPKYWDGIAAGAALVSALTKTDGSAGTDPPERGYSLVLHNDKLLLGNDVELRLGAAGRVSSNLTDTVLSDSGEAFIATDGIAAGFLLYPDVTNWPRNWYTITSLDADDLTCTGATMTDVAATGDTYLVTRRYYKQAWYTDETEPAHWPTTNVLVYGDGDDDRMQKLVSWKSSLYTLCRSQIWRTSGYGPTTGWSKERISKQGGPLAPASVVDAIDALYWWGGEGIVAYTGGTTKPTSISGAIRDLAEDALNPALRHEVTGAYFQGKLFWSYATSDSGVNNRTLVYDLDSGNWSVRNFGMYCPERFIDADSTEVLYFWEPTSGCICQYDEDVISHAGIAPAVTVSTQFIAGSDPVEIGQPLRLKVSLLAEANETVNVYAAVDYVDSYEFIGSLVPIGTDVSERTGVNATDTMYTCDFPQTLQGSAISTKLSFAPTAPVEIFTIELVFDPLESATNQ